MPSRTKSTGGQAPGLGGGATKLVPRGQVGVEPALIRDVGSALDGRKGRQKRGPRAERPRRHTRQRQGTCRSWGATKARLWPRARGQRMGLATDSSRPGCPGYVPKRAKGWDEEARRTVPLGSRGDHAVPPGDASNPRPWGNAWGWSPTRPSRGARAWRRRAWATPERTSNRER